MPILWTLTAIAALQIAAPDRADAGVSAGGTSIKAESSPSDGSTTPADEHARQLQTCREGILDERSRQEDRRRWADLLLSYGTPESGRLVIELLSLPNRPEVAKTLCMAIAERGRVVPGRLIPEYVEPLMALLGADSEELRLAAGVALADFADFDVADRLWRIASDNEASRVRRLAAVDALGAITHRREVVDLLVRLLDLNVPEITIKVIASLEPLAQRSLGTDVGEWKRWWAKQSEMGSDAWLTEQVRLYRARGRKQASELAACRTEMERDQAATTARIRDMQRDLLRLIGADQREAKLVEWLDDPLPTVRLAALSILRARIADEGKRPEGEVLAALLRMLRSSPASLRRESLEIVRNLEGEAVVEAVVARLTEERDPGTRIAVFQALRKLGSPRAVPSLIAEIVDSSSRPEAVREAALALAAIAAKVENRSMLDGAIEPLKNRMKSALPEQTDLRAALLSAMSAIGDPAFNAEFQSAIESEDAGLLQAAIRGLAGQGDPTRKPRFRSLSTHSDPRVRLAAVEALGKLGRDDADLEPLLARLPSTSEPNELVREAAWRSLREVQSRKPLQDRIRLAERLRENPDNEARYLTELLASVSQSDEKSPELDGVRDRLATILMTMDREADAIPYLRDLYESALIRNPGNAGAVGLRWLEAALVVPTQQEIASIVTRLMDEASSNEQRNQIVNVLDRYFDAAGSAQDVERKKMIVADLKSKSLQREGVNWSERLADWSARFPAPPPPRKEPS